MKCCLASGVQFFSIWREIISKGILICIGRCNYHEGLIGMKILAMRWGHKKSVYSWKVFNCGFRFFSVNFWTEQIKLYLVVFHRNLNKILLYSNLKLTTSSRFFRFSYRKIISETSTDELFWRNSYGPRRKVSPRKLIRTRSTNILF